MKKQTRGRCIALILSALMVFSTIYMVPETVAGVMAENPSASVVAEGRFYGPGDVAGGTRSGAPWALDANGVTSMGSMFSGASSLTELDVSGWDTGAVTSMGGMFHGATALQRITFGRNFVSVSANSFPANNWRNLRTDDARVSWQLWEDLRTARYYNETWQWAHLPTLLGDINNDGQINILDLTTLRLYLSGQTVATINLANADVTGDGDVNADDANLLRRYLAGHDITLGNS